ncbi:MAG: hypothetical protein ACLTSZ_03900 [Lachnospiraceae bacterium]
MEARYGAIAMAEGGTAPGASAVSGNGYPASVQAGGDRQTRIYAEYGRWRQQWSGKEYSFRS